MPPGIEKKGGLSPGLNKERGSGKKDKRPRGWDRGKKKGWKGADMPPGQQKAKEAKKSKKWD